MNLGEPKPTVYVIAGPNGAGKTTFANEFLPDFVECTEFLNADLIAEGLSPFSPESQNFRAGRLFLERIDELRRKRADFSFETTFSGRTTLRLLQQLRSQEYRICVFFLWLPSWKIALERVVIRVRQGGHNVAEVDIKRRYESGLRNLFQLYLSVADAWYLYDAACLPPELVAMADDSRESIINKPLFDQIRSSVKD